MLKQIFFLFLLSYIVAIISFFVIAPGNSFPIFPILFAALPIPVLLSFFLIFDKDENEKRWAIFCSFLWGAIGATSIAINVNTPFVNLLGKPLTSFFIAPISEELAKAVVFVVFGFMFKYINSITDGIVYASLSALGFSMVENIVYYMQAFEEGINQGLELFFARGVVTAFIHPICTAMTGIGVGLYLTSNKGHRKLYLILGFTSAVILHGLWNAMTFSSDFLFSLGYNYLFLPILIIMALIAFFGFIYKRKNHV